MTSTSDEILGGARRLAGRALGSVVTGALGFLLMFIGVGWLAVASARLVEWLAGLAGPWPPFILAVAFFLIALVTLEAAERRSLHGADGVNNGAVAGFVAGCAFLWVYLFGALGFLLAELRLVDFGVSTESRALIGQLGDGLIWYLFDMIPLLEINDSIGWQQELFLEGGAKGWFLLAFRGVILLSLFRLAERLYHADEKT